MLEEHSCLYHSILCLSIALQGVVRDVALYIEALHLVHLKCHGSGIYVVNPPVLGVHKNLEIPVLAQVRSRIRSSYAEWYVCLVRLRPTMTAQLAGEYKGNAYLLSHLLRTQDGKDILKDASKKK